MSIPGRDEWTDINLLVDELSEGGVNTERMSQTDIALALKICNRKGAVIWLSDHTSFALLFVNRSGEGFYGFEAVPHHKNSIELYSEIAHPDHFDGFHKYISFFNENPTGLFRMTYYVRTASGQYKWVYSEQKALSYTKSGSIRHVISIAYDVDEWMEKDRLQLYRGGSAAELKKYQTLTPREREILDLVSAEWTSQEIADRLYLEPSTISSHRKNLLHKLGLKSSLGMVKYSLRYSKGRMIPGST